MPALNPPTPLPLPLIPCLLYDPDDNEEPTGGVAKFVNDLGAYAGRPARTTGYLGMTLFIYNYAFPLERAATLEWDWVLFVLGRNLFLMVLFFGGWHYFLYESPFRHKLADRKYNKKAYDPSADRLWTTSGFCISTTFEIGLMHLMATGRLAHYTDFWQYPYWSVFHMLLVPYYVEFHFFMVHKYMHYKPLYRWVHSLHHKSYNPGPWSGLSMHPVEHLIFFTSCCLCLFYELHPLHMLFPCVYARISPIAGHDGFDRPAGGSYVHYLHHAKFTVNFGTPVVPLDRVFGSHFDKNGRVDLLGTGQYAQILKENWFWGSLAIAATGCMLA